MPPLMGSVPTVACVVVAVPLEGISVIMGGKDIVPPPLSPLKKGSGLVTAMGLDGAVNRFDLEW